MKTKDKLAFLLRRSALVGTAAILAACVNEVIPKDSLRNFDQYFAVEQTHEVSCVAKGKGEKLVQELLGYELWFVGPVGVDDANYVQVRYAIRNKAMQCPFFVVSSISESWLRQGRRNVFLNNLMTERGPYDESYELKNEIKRTTSQCDNSNPKDPNCYVENAGVLVDIQNNILESRSETFVLVNGIVFDSADGSVVN